MPKEKANTEVEKIQYLNRHCYTNENSEKAKSESLHKRISGQLRLPLAFILASQRVFYVCLFGGAKRRHLSMTSTRHGAKSIIYSNLIYIGCHQ